MDDCVIVSELELVCRACLQSIECPDDLHSTQEVKETFSSCTAIEVPLDSEVPWQICSQCVTIVDRWKSFRDMCLENKDRFGEGVRLEEEVQQTEPFNAPSPRTNEEEVAQTLQPLPESPRVNDEEEHQPTNSFACESCDKTFSNAWRLKAHRTVHSDLRPFSCEECGRSFKFVENLRMHERRHRATEKQFVCDQCDRRFFHASELRTHAKRHDPAQRLHQCTHCEQAFFNASNLRDHRQAKHAGPGSPFVCDTCGRGFGRSALLRDHVLTHTGEKPHRCAQCQRCFRKASTLRTHMKTHR